MRPSDSRFYQHKGRALHAPLDIIHKPVKTRSHKCVNPAFFPTSLSLSRWLFAHQSVLCYSKIYFLFS